MWAYRELSRRFQQWRLRPPVLAELPLLRNTCCPAVELVACTVAERIQLSNSPSCCSARLGSIAHAQKWGRCHNLTVYRNFCPYKTKERSIWPIVEIWLILEVIHGWLRRRSMSWLSRGTTSRNRGSVSSDVLPESSLCNHYGSTMPSFLSTAYKTVSGVNGPLVILDQVKVIACVCATWNYIEWFAVINLYILCIENFHMLIPTFLLRCVCLFNELSIPVLSQSSS